MIISQAGRVGAVTIATNMAGRGTDIQLGGNAEMRILQELGESPDPDRTAAITAEVEAERQRVRELGGLFVLGTERHESRRIDNQLRGRSGRQGDPGRSKFYLSLDDDLMRIFGSERMDGMLQAPGPQGRRGDRPSLDQQGAGEGPAEGRGPELRDPKEPPQIRRRDERPAQGRLRAAPRAHRRRPTWPIRSRTCGDQVVDDLAARHIPERAYPEQWDVERLHADLTRYLALDLPVAEWAGEEGITQDEVKRRILEATGRKVAHKIATYGEPMMRMAEKSLLLQILDHLWKEHLLHLDHLRQGIHLRGYGQRDPLNEYKSEAFALFDTLLENLRLTVTQVLSHLEIRMPEPEPEPAPPPQPAPTRVRSLAMAEAGGGGEDSGMDPRDPSTWGKVQRNAPCPCGSGKKYKQCHGRLA